MLGWSCMDMEIMLAGVLGGMIQFRNLKNYRGERAVVDERTRMRHVDPRVSQHLYTEITQVSVADMV